MKIFISYRCIVNGIEGIWTDSYPEGSKVIEEHRVYVPDDGKIFKKGDEYADTVLDSIREWEEVDDPNKKPEEGGNDEATVD